MCRLERRTGRESQLPIDWDTFGTDGDKGTSVGLYCNIVTMSLLKVVAYIVVFCAVLALAMLSNGALLLAASNVRPTSNYSPSKPALLCADEPENGMSCYSLRRNASRQYTESGLEECLPSGEYRKLLYANECVTHRVMWGWSLFVMVCMPYALTFVRNLRRIVTGRFRRRVNWRTLFFVMIIETLYAVGTSLLVFIVLPTVDSVIEVSRESAELSLLKSLRVIITFTFVSNFLLEI